GLLAARRHGVHPRSPGARPLAGGPAHLAMRPRPLPRLHAPQLARRRRLHRPREPEAARLGPRGGDSPHGGGPGAGVLHAAPGGAPPGRTSPSGGPGGDAARSPAALVARALPPGAPAALARADAPSRLQLLFPAALQTPAAGPPGHGAKAGQGSLSGSARGPAGAVAPVLLRLARRPGPAAALPAPSRQAFRAVPAVGPRQPAAHRKPRSNARRRRAGGVVDRQLRSCARRP